MFNVACFHIYLDKFDTIHVQLTDWQSDVGEIRHRKSRAPASESARLPQSCDSLAQAKPKNHREDIAPS